MSSKQSILERWAKPESYIPVHEETITLNINGEDTDFDLIHNLNWLNLDIDKAIEEWAAQTRKPTIMDLCRFVMSQATNDMQLICFPKKEWIEFQKKQELNSTKKVRKK